jgi:2-polyprenyl-6-methoxyphenol hydroxylase-like FAD-dependent oxidoreductase
MAGVVVLADALADRPGRIEDASSASEAPLRPWAEAAQRTARRNARLFTPADRFQLLVRAAVLRLATLPFLAPIVQRSLNREAERP